MGGNGNKSNGITGGGGGITEASIKELRSMLALRQRGGEDRQNVDRVLSVARDMEKEYNGAVLEGAFQVADMKGRAKQGVLGFYNPSTGDLAINQTYWGNSQGFEAAYAESVKQGFHPKSGGKTAMEAVSAHEMGHAITDVAGIRSGLGMDRVSDRIVADAVKASGMKAYDFKVSISGYAKTNNHETIAESVADVYCNGARASKQSILVVNELKKYL